MSFDMKMRLNDSDIQRCINACKVYQDQTGSEWMWEQYEALINKLMVYADQYSTDDYNE
tara:strand:- start:353 stop:529 length:177 start_codon:yes stop_codon:yes gene_type:complete